MLPCHKKKKKPCSWPSGYTITSLILTRWTSLTARTQSQVLELIPRRGYYWSFAAEIRDGTFGCFHKFVCEKLCPYGRPPIDKTWGLPVNQSVNMPPAQLHKSVRPGRRKSLPVAREQYWRHQGYDSSTLVKSYPNGGNVWAMLFMGYFIESQLMFTRFTRTIKVKGEAQHSDDFKFKQSERALHLPQLWRQMTLASRSIVIWLAIIFGVPVARWLYSDHRDAHLGNRI